MKPGGSPCAWSETATPSESFDHSAPTVLFVSIEFQRPVKVSTTWLTPQKKWYAASARPISAGAATSAARVAASP